MSKVLIDRKALIITCLAVILIDFFLRKAENYYLQVFFKERKYIEKEKKMMT